MIVGKAAVAVKLMEAREKTLDIVERVGPFRVTRELDALPTRVGG
jgi:hypothetical protein